MKGCDGVGSAPMHCFWCDMLPCWHMATIIVVLWTKQFFSKKLWTKQNTSLNHLAAFFNHTLIPFSQFTWVKKLKIGYFFIQFFRTKQMHFGHQRMLVLTCADLLVLRGPLLPCPKLLFGKKHPKPYIMINSYVCQFIVISHTHIYIIIVLAMGTMYPNKHVCVA
jgi:hypothetical protein